MDHKAYKNKIYLYFHKELDELTRKDFENHLSGCQECRDELAFYRQMSESYQKLPDPDIPEESINFVINNISEKTKKNNIYKLDWLKFKNISDIFSIRPVYVGLVSAVFILAALFSWKYIDKSRSVKQAAKIFETTEIFESASELDNYIFKIDVLASKPGEIEKFQEKIDSIKIADLGSIFNSKSEWKIKSMEEQINQLKKEQIFRRNAI